MKIYLFLIHIKKYLFLIFYQFKLQRISFLNNIFLKADLFWIKKVRFSLKTSERKGSESRRLIERNPKRN